MRAQGKVAAESSAQSSMVGTSMQVASASNALFATLSHELRTPLNGLLGIVQLLNLER